MSVTVKMTGDDRDLVKAQERVEKGAAQITAEYKKLTKESVEMQRFAKRAWEESLTPLQKYEQEMEKLNRTYQGAARETNEYKAAVAKLEAQHTSLGKVGPSSLKSIGMELGAVVAGYTSIDAALNTIVASYDNWVQNTNEIADSTRAAMKELKALAMMMEPTESRAVAIEVANRYAGVMTAGESWDTFQAMMSAVGNEKQAAFKATDWIAQAIQMRVKPEDALEVARQAVVQNLDIGQSMRAVAASGEFGIRDAPTMAKAARAISNWAGDPTFGWAAAATIGGKFGESVDSYLKQGGMALSGVSKASKWFEAQGLGPEATQQQRLEELVKQSKNTAVELVDIGLVDAEARDAVLVLVEKFENVSRDYKTLGTAMTDPRFMQQRLARAASGVPEIPLSEAIEATRGRFQAARMFGTEELKHQLYTSILAEELQKRGASQFLGARFYNAKGELEEGLYSTFARRTAPMLWPLPPAGKVEDAERAARERFNELLSGIEKNTTKEAPRPRVTQPEQ